MNKINSSPGKNDEQRTTADGITSASLVQNGMLSEVRVREVKREFLSWFYAKDKVYFPTPNQCFDYLKNKFGVTD